MTFLKMPNREVRKPIAEPQKNGESIREDAEHAERQVIDMKTSQRFNATLASRSKFTNASSN